MFKRKPKVLTPAQAEEIRTKDFFDCILPGTIKFMSDHYILGDSYRCVWAIREYPPTTEEQAILAQLADRSGVTLRIYHRLVESMEQRKIVQNATRRNKLKTGSNDMNETIEAEGNLQDVIELLANLRKNKEPLLHCSVFLEMKAKSLDALKELQSDISMELTRSKISVDRLTLRQKEGFLSVLPTGYNQFGAQFERVLPASSVANLYPFNFSGKTDPHGLYIGRDKYGTNILVDFDRRAEDKTTSNILILGNSGQGKSYLLKLLLTNIRESGKRVICLDPESEYEELSEALGGCYIDFLSGEYTINPLEPKAWTDGPEELDLTAPEAFKKVTRLSQHIAFLKDFFRAYKDFNDVQLDTIYGCLLVAPRTAISFVLSFYFLRQRIGGFHASSLLCCLITSLSLETLFCGLLPCMITRGSRYLIVSLSLFYMILTGPNIGKEMHLTEGEFQATTLYSKIRIIAVSLIYIIATLFEKTQDIANGLSLGILMSAFSLALANIISKRRSKHERKS